MANIPARPKLCPLLTTNKVTITTERNTMVFETRIESRNFQFTEVKSSCAKDMKIKEGSENVPTKVFMPFASVSEIRFIRPAKYLENKNKNCIFYADIGFYSSFLRIVMLRVKTTLSQRYVVQQLLML